MKILFILIPIIGFSIGQYMTEVFLLSENSKNEMSYAHHSNLSEDLDETSGLAFSVKRPHLLYQINDSGNAPIIFRTDLEGNIESSLDLGVASKDFESLSVARCGNTTCIYVFDTGDNLHLRNRYQIYEISEDNFELKNLKALKKWSIHYPDGMSHDTEASAYNPKTHKILLFTKGAKSQVFELDLNDLQKEMKQIAELNIYKVTGSAYHKGYFYIMNLNSIYKIDEKGSIKIRLLRSLKK